MSACAPSTTTIQSPSLLTGIANLRGLKRHRDANEDENEVGDVEVEVENEIEDVEDKNEVEDAHSGSRREIFDGEVFRGAQKVWYVKGKGNNRAKGREIISGFPVTDVYVFTTGHAWLRS
jgi:hypothetical protein